MPRETNRTYNGKTVYIVQKSGRGRGCINRDCLNCGEEFFAALNNVKKGLGKYCSKECSSSHRAANGQMSGENNPAYKGKYDYVEKVKEESVCEECGEDRNPALCFHHQDPEDKEEDVSRMARKKEYTLNEVKNEVEKCKIICLNCHAIKHSNKY